MTSARFKPKGPDDFDFLGMPDEDFELMNFLLVRLDFERTFKPANVRDGGADTVQRNHDKQSKYDRCWQSKHFPKRIGWAKCEQSLQEALNSWHPEHYTFIFPRDLTEAEEKTFAKKFGDAEITVDYWNGSELYARLIGSDDGERIARWFFHSSQLERKEMFAAIAAGAGGGPVHNVSEALERLRNVGAYLVDRDPFFDYPTSVHRHGGASQPTAPGAVMSVLETDGQVAARTDVVPVAPEVMKRFAPTFILSTTPDDAGRLAGERLQTLLADGNGGEIEQGLQMTFTQLPPGLAHLLGEPVSGTFVFGKPEFVRRPIPPWRARLTAGFDPATNPSLDMLLTQVEPPEDWDTALEGTTSGLTARLLMAMRETGGQLTFNMHYERDDSAARGQLAAVEFMHGLDSAGQLLITDVGNTAREPVAIPVPSQPPNRLAQLEAFFRDVVTIEDWANVRFKLPLDILYEDAKAVASVSEDIRCGGFTGTLREFEVTATAAGVKALRPNQQLAVEQQWAARIFGQVVQLGYTLMVLTDYEIASVEPVEGTDDEFVIRIAAPGEVQATLSTTPRMQSMASGSAVAN